MTDVDPRQLPDIASRALGATVMAANDDFFADVHALIAPGPPQHDPSTYGPRGKVYDGWETRRRRVPGEDTALVRLATPGVPRLIDIDTRHFRANYPPAASLHATTVLGYPTPEELAVATWWPLLDHVELTGDASNTFRVDGGDLATHVRLTIHPDGGVARLRVHGEVIPDPRRLGGRIDLASVLRGGTVEECSNMFYASPANVLAPGRAHVMSDGWETARRRDDGNDWLVVRLAAPGHLHEVVLDTSRFVGNAPGEAQLTDADTDAPLLHRTRLLPDTEHVFRLLRSDPVSRVRLDIYPDGGLSRLRIRGTVPAEARGGIADRWLDSLPVAQRALADPADFF